MGAVNYYFERGSDYYVVCEGITQDRDRQLDLWFNSSRVWLEDASGVRWVKHRDPDLTVDAKEFFLVKLSSQLVG